MSTIQHQTHNPAAGTDAQAARQPAGSPADEGDTHAVSSVQPQGGGPGAHGPRSVRMDNHHNARDTELHTARSILDLLAYHEGTLPDPETLDGLLVAHSELRKISDRALEAFLADVTSFPAATSPTTGGETEPPVGPCPDWCSLPAGHGWDSKQPAQRVHAGPEFGDAFRPRVSVSATEYAGEAQLRPMVMSTFDVDADLDVREVADLVQHLLDATDWAEKHAALPWWCDAANPPCRSWCTTEHKSREFADGALLVCRHDVVGQHGVSVEISAATRADESRGAAPGALVYERGELEIALRADVDDTYHTAGAAKDAATELVILIAKAARVIEADTLVGSDGGAA